MTEAENLLDQTSIGICFFGITRSIPFTSHSILASVIDPASRSGKVTSSAHFFRQDRILNPRTGEDCMVIDGSECQLNLDELVWSSAGSSEIVTDLERLSEFGDAWGDDFASLRNLVHQLHSLKRVTALAERNSPDIVAFIRPDLNYHDSLYTVFRKALKAHRSGKSVVFAPDWQRWGGVNDRFAIAVGRDAALAYGNRIDYAREFCESRGQPLHSERLLAFALQRAGVPVVHIPHRASRVRANGVQSWEDFDRFFQKAVQRRLNGRIKQRAKTLHRVLSFANRHTCRLLWGDRYINIDPPEGVVARSRTEEEALRRRRS